MKAWLKFGMAGIIIGIVLFMLLLLASAFLVQPKCAGNICGITFSQKIVMLFTAIIILPALLIGAVFHLNSNFWNSFGEFLVVLYWFLAGLIIGKIIKRRSRAEKKGKKKPGKKKLRKGKRQK